MRPPVVLAPLALLAIVLAGCGSHSSSDAQQPSGNATTPTKSLELRPVYARYAAGAPLGGVQLGPSVPQKVITAMEHYDCSSRPTALQGMLMECDAGHTVYLLKAPIVTGEVTSAAVKQIGHQNLYFVKVTFDAAAAKVLADATTSLPGTELAFALGNSVLTAPIIDSSMADGHVGITGNYTRKQAQRLADRIMAH